MSYKRKTNIIINGSRIERQIYKGNPHDIAYLLSQKLDQDINVDMFERDGRDYKCKINKNFKKLPI